MAAARTPANGADRTRAPLLLADRAPRALPGRFVRADSASHDPDGRARWARDQRVLVASRRGAHAPDDGSAVRQVFPARRSQAMKRGNAQCKPRFALSAQLPTKGLVATQRFVLGAVCASHLTVLDQFLAGAVCAAACKRPCKRREDL